MNKEHYEFKEIDDIEETVINLLGVEEVYNNLSKWLGYETLEKFLRDLCRDYDIDIDEETEENDNSN
jgi:hypothetical protein